ncbi:MAG: SSS family solute:Na+ symporter [Verrucomicrobiales bacterium]|jgi:SSS family solute:Na+ symporter
MSKLAWQDNLVLLVYIVGMIVLGIWLSRRKRSDDEYFLAGRKMPWFAVGISVIASILSSVTYLSEPGEIWKSGVTHISGKMLAIPFEMLFVWLVCIPFLMKFRFTSVYEYLESRFGNGARLMGVVLFVMLGVLWMGVVVLVTSRVLAHVSGFHLLTVIGVVGIVATIYTVLGGLRAVIWTDVIQVILLIGGGLFTIGFVIYSTGTWIPDWFATSTAYLKEKGGAIPTFDLDPFTRATVVTVAINMLVWHVCTHLSNQMTVQRYFSTSDPRAARRSFLVGSLFGVGINLMLMTAGLALLYFYYGQQVPVDIELDSEKPNYSLIFPSFAISRLPPGLGGAILAALLAAAMSSIDSGVNSIATVLSVEHRKRRPSSEKNHVKFAMTLTLFAGIFITGVAVLLTQLPSDWGIIDLLPRTFNAITAPLGGLFLIGMFVRRAGQTQALTGTLCGLLTSVAIGYSRELGLTEKSLSFTLIMPSALIVTVGVAWIISRFGPPPKGALGGLTWRTRNEPVE